MELELAFYLKNLLYNYEEVIIPGLGTLITKYKPAEVNDSEHTISPPSKYLIFDELKTQPGNLLIEYIAFIEHLSKDAAEMAVAGMVGEIHNKLNIGETVLLDGIGYFSKSGSSIRFEKIQDYNYLTDSYGLSKVSFEPLETKHTPYVAEPMVKKTRHSYTSLLLFIFLAVILGGGVVLYLNYPDITDFIFRKKESPANNILKPSVNEKLRADTSRASNLESFFDSATDKRKALALSDSIRDSQSNVKYYIIAGSFKTLPKAQQLSKEMENEGYKNEIIRFEENTYRISLGTYTDKSKAIEDLLKIRFTKGDDAVWLLTK